MDKRARFIWRRGLRTATSTASIRSRLRFGYDRAMSRKSKRNKRQRDKRRYANSPAMPQQAGRARPVAPWFTTPEMACPCGSGSTFAGCCEPNLANGDTASTIAPEPGNPILSERRLRADLTRYLGLIHRDTLPMISRRHPLSSLSISIDVDAVEEAVRNIAVCLRQQARASDALRLFDHISHTVPIRQFGERMLALKAVWLNAVLNDEAAACKELAPVDPHAATDSGLLEVYLGTIESDDVFESIRIVDRLIALRQDRMNRIFNLTTKAKYHLLAGDKVAAAQAEKRAVELIPEDAGTDFDSFEIMTLIRLYIIKWKTEAIEADYQEALAWLGRVPLDELTPQGQADVLHMHGSLLGDHGDTANGIEKLEASLASHATDAALVRLAELYVAAVRIEDALRAFEKLARMNLSAHLRAECLTTRAGLAIMQKDVHALRKIVKDLQGVDIRHRYFAEARNRACLSILQILEENGDAWDSVPNQSLMFTILRKIGMICDYLELKPNLCGVGINLNKLGEQAKMAGKWKRVRRHE